MNSPLHVPSREPGPTAALQPCPGLVLLQEEYPFHETQSRAIARTDFIAGSCRDQKHVCAIALELPSPGGCTLALPAGVHHLTAPLGHHHGNPDGGTNVTPRGVLRIAVIPRHSSLKSSKTHKYFCFKVSAQQTRDRRERCLRNMRAHLLYFCNSVGTPHISTVWISTG